MSLWNIGNVSEMQLEVLTYGSNLGKKITSTGMLVEVLGLDDKVQKA